MRVTQAPGHCDSRVAARRLGTRHLGRRPHPSVSVALNPRLRARAYGHVRLWFARDTCKGTGRAAGYASRLGITTVTPRPPTTTVTARGPRGVPVQTAWLETSADFREEMEKAISGARAGGGCRPLAQRPGSSCGTLNGPARSSKGSGAALRDQPTARPASDVCGERVRRVDPMQHRVPLP